MSIAIATLAAPAAPSLVRLDEATYAGAIADYVAARAAKTRADAESRAADGIIKAMRSRLLAAMGDAPAAICGERVLTRKEVAAAGASLTLRAGEKLAWSSVAGLTIGNRYVAADEVATIYGGRSGSTDLTITG